MVKKINPELTSEREKTDDSRLTRKEMANRARQASEQERFGNDKLSVFSVSLKKIGEFGIGIQLYFMLMKYLAEIGRAHV